MCIFCMLSRHKIKHLTARYVTDITAEISKLAAAKSYMADKSPETLNGKGAVTEIMFSIISDLSREDLIDLMGQLVIQGAKLYLEEPSFVKGLEKIRAHLE